MVKLSEMEKLAGIVGRQSVAQPHDGQPDQREER
jgi:hypothetical protein